MTDRQGVGLAVDALGALPMLAIETSQRGGGVALAWGDGRTAHERRDESTRDELIVSIDRLVRRAGLTARQLRCVAVSIGPGGFTGLRVAVATAKMLAETLGATLVGVPSALVVAEHVAASPGDRALSLLATKERGGGGGPGSSATTWATPLVWTPEGWRLETSDRGGGGLSRVDALDLRSTRLVIGERLFLQAAAAACDRIGIAWHEPRCDPRACLTAGARWLARYGPTDAPALAPIYPREPEAVSLWRARGGAP